MYGGVPMICPVRVSCSVPATAAIFARPKSISFGVSPTSRSAVRMTFDGLRSRWMMPAACAASSPHASRVAMCTARWIDSAFSRASTVASVSPRHVLHDEERRIADDEVEEARDVRMLDGAHRLRLVLEALAELGIGEQLRLEHLDGDDRADGAVLGDEHLAHRAAAEHLEQAIAIADDVARR